MSEAVNAVKTAIKPRTIIATLLGLVVVFIILDAMKLTNYIFYPYSALNAKVFKGKLPGGSEFNG